MVMDLAISGGAYLARPGSGRFSAVSADEVARLVAATSTTKTRLILRVLWATGARISEVLALKVGDVDTRRNEITIRRLKRRRPFAQVLPLPADVAGELRLWIRSQDLRSRSRLFRTARQNVHESVRALGRRVLGRDISPKSFRHGCAYRMAARGVHPLVISRALGHASLSSALAYYHPSETDLREAMG